MSFSRRTITGCVALAMCTQVTTGCTSMKRIAPATHASAAPFGPVKSGDRVELRLRDGRTEAVVVQSLDGPDLIYLSLDIDVIDPGLAPGTGTPEPGGMLTREVLRAIRQIVGAVDLAGMDIVEVSPPYDHAETTAMAANRAALEAISALAARHAAGNAVRWGGRAPVEDRFPPSPAEPHGHPG